jgi:predicted RNA-binding protein YlqC (UPF0109 family)
VYEMDKEFVEYVVKALVNHPDEVVVRRSVDDMGILLELSVNPEDMGKVIGKAGATAKSLRTLLRVLGSHNDERVNLKIIEPEGSDYERPESDAQAAPVAMDESSEYIARAKSDMSDLDDFEV